MSNLARKGFNIQSKSQPASQYKTGAYCWSETFQGYMHVSLPLSSCSCSRRTSVTKIRGQWGQASKTQDNKTVRPRLPARMNHSHSAPAWSLLPFCIPCQVLWRLFCSGSSSALFYAFLPSFVSLLFFSPSFCGLLFTFISISQTLNGKCPKGV